MIRQLVFAILLLFGTQLVASEDKALFWKVESESATVYLLGSIHYADKSFYPLRGDIEKAFEDSGTLVVEIHMGAESASSYHKLVSGEGSYHGDETIKDHISKQTYEALEQRLEKLGIPIERVIKQKPGILVLTLAAAHARYLGLDPTLGIDPYFLSRAEGKKKIVALESVEQQLRIFLNIPNGDLMLKESLYTMKGAKELLKEMVDAWKRGDEESMRSLLFDNALDDYPEFASIYDRLFFQRNINMANTIKSYLGSKGSYFVVVGAGHFLGEQGIIHLLKKSGFIVERL